MHNDSMGPNNVEAMRAGLMQARNVSSQRVDDAPPNMAEQQSGTIFNNIPTRDVPPIPGRFVPPNMNSSFNQPSSVFNYAYLVNLISSLARYITQVKLNYENKLDDVFSKNITLYEIDIINYSSQTPYSTQIAHQLSVYICKELADFPSLLDTYTQLMSVRFKNLPSSFNIIELLNQSKLSYLVPTFNNDKSSQFSSTATIEESKTTKEEVLSNEQLTSLVIDTAKALDSLRSEVRNLAAKTMPMGGHY